jgi:peroxiredoxin Q/BCP
MKKLIHLAAALAAVFSLMTGTGRAEGMPKAGDTAPKFEAQDQDGKSWKLDDLRAKEAVLLYFYPKDDTPGCTKEACGLRDRIGDLKKDHVEVLGVSFDSAESHKKFREKYHLNFPLLVDSEGKLADSYGTHMVGKMMSRRVSFLIDKNGKIVHVTDNPSADVHLTEMKEAVSKLSSK